MRESRVSRKYREGTKEETPGWIYIMPDDGNDPGKRTPESKQLEMLESIRNTLEGILTVLKDSEIVYMRGKEKNG